MKTEKLDMFLKSICEETPEIPISIEQWIDSSDGKSVDVVQIPITNIQVDGDGLSIIGSADNSNNESNTSANCLMKLLERYINLKSSNEIMIKIDDATNIRKYKNIEILEDPLRIKLKVSSPAHGFINCRVGCYEGACE